MDAMQTIINIVIGICGALGMAVLWAVWTRLDTQDKELKTLAILVAGDYVKKDDFDKSLDGMYTILRRIEDKLDRKADKG